MSEAHRALVAERVQMQRRLAGKKKAPAVSAPQPMPKRRVALPHQQQQAPTETTPLRKQSSSSMNSGGADSSSNNSGRPKFERPKFDERNYVPCRYFAAGGNCKDGDKCPYSHHPDLISIFAGGSMPQDVFSPAQRPERSSSKKAVKKRRSPSQACGERRPPQQVGDAMNVDGMSYEQLTDLCDRMGKVKVGVDKCLLETLPCITVKTQTTEKCAICLEVFSVGDTMKILPCGHPFHADCINEWLDGSKKCPYCNEEITTARVTTNSTTPPPARRPSSSAVPSSSATPTPSTEAGGVIRRLPISNTTSTPVSFPPLGSSNFSPQRGTAGLYGPQSGSTSGGGGSTQSTGATSSTTTAGGSSRTPLVFSSAAAVLASLADDP